MLKFSWISFIQFPGKHLNRQKRNEIELMTEIGKFFILLPFLQQEKVILLFSMENKKDL